MYNEINSDVGDFGFVPVVFVRDSAEATFYQSLLEDHGIEVRVDEDFQDSKLEPDDVDDSVHGIAVMVDAEHLAEAEAVIGYRLDEEDVDIEYDDDDSDEEDDEFADLEEFDPDENN